MIRYICIIWIVCLLGVNHLLAGDESSRLQSAVAMYEAGEWQSALKEFESLSREFQKPDLYLYVGNCHVNLGDHTQALVWYFKGLQLDAENAELKHNIGVVREKLGLPARMDQLRSIKGVFMNLIGHVSLDTHRLIWVTCFCIVFGIMIFSLVCHRYPFKYGWLLLLFACLWLIQAGIVYVRHKDISMPSGIVRSKDTALRYGPSLRETEVVALPRGIYFRVVAKTDGGWYHVVIEDGKKGWVYENDLLFI